MIVTIEGIGCWGEGLHGWAATQAILQGKTPYESESLKLPPPEALPANERRRASQVIRLAVLCAAEACQQAGREATTLPAIFASSNGDGFIINRILDALTSPAGAVSPSLFHNSVHNAPAGYWMIGHHSQQPAVSLGLHDETLAASLLKAAVEAQVRKRPVLFCLYDAPIPGSLGMARRTDHPFGCAFVLSPGSPSDPSPSSSPGSPSDETGQKSRRPGIQLALSLTAGEDTTGNPTALPESRASNALPAAAPETLPDALAAMARHNPAAQALPLLQAMACGQDCQLSLPYGANRVEITLTHAQP